MTERTMHLQDVHSGDASGNSAACLKTAVKPQFSESAASIATECSQNPNNISIIPHILVGNSSKYGKRSNLENLSLYQMRNTDILIFMCI